MRYDEASGESWTIYYRPSDGRQYDDVQSVCGENLVTVRMDGGYQVYDVTAEAVVAEGTNYTYYSDAVKIWRDYGSNVFVEAPCYDSAKEVMSAWCSWNTGDPYISVTCLDGSVEVLDLTGQLVNSRASAEDKSLIYHKRRHDCRKPAVRDRTGPYTLFSRRRRKAVLNGITG